MIGPRSTTVYHAWCSCDPPTFDTFWATKREAEAWRREHRAAYGHSVEYTTIKPVRVELNRRGIARALTIEPQR